MAHSENLAFGMQKQEFKPILNCIVSKFGPHETLSQKIPKVNNYAHMYIHMHVCPHKRFI